ncbi:L-tyrosine:2-oxoglutarate aminotransferase [Lentinus brumalis]|uniref:L-tyrosine:2-oxoglutarate aminotransferase n=1 Tax=Lentinus brumalis TaxID=2498619 RepID=A0A371CZ41_9APHY|nr:L-tyrosine:2-oxoglutarate aminotransferase [Polyporus brumalis]
MASVAVDAPKFVDLTHHLAPEVLVRKTNPLKDIIRISWENPHLVSLANGDPHHSLYPIRRVEYEVASAADEDPVSAWRSLGASAPTQLLTSSRDADSPRLHQASLAYGHGVGLPDALRTVTALNNAYHTAPHHVATMTLGNADAITKVFRMLGSAGDYFLADEFTFGPMPIAAEAHGIKWVPVRIDSGGIIPEELERILANWDSRRGKRPHVLYAVPCGQNPTGSTLSLERRKQIYEIAQKYDLIIVEDDPYYFLQYDPPSTEAHSTQTQLKPFPVSFLSLDVDGRVIRIDSFSKIMAPGLRLGWITSQPAFQQHLVRFIDLSSQQPSGFPQALVSLLLDGWGLAGFDRWVRSLRLDYQRRRDFLLGLFEREVAPGGLASVDVPEAGMFLWVRVHLERHPRFTRKAEEVVEGARTNARELMQELFEACIRGGLLIVPATVFVLPTETGYEEEGSVHIDDRSNFLRATFAGSEETMAAGMPILGKVLKEFFADPSTARIDATSTVA